MKIEVKKDTGIKNIRDFHSTLIEKIEADSDTIIMDLGGIERIDLSVATLIKAACRDLKKTGRCLKMMNISDTVRNQLYLCGFNI